jgi:hypothetical protein
MGAEGGSGEIWPFKIFKIFKFFKFFKFPRKEA